MINKNLFKYVLVFVLFLSIILLLPEDKSYLLTDVSKSNNNDYNLKIMAIDYGKDTFGDTVLLESKGKYLLMDTGGKISDTQEDQAKYLINYLEKNNVHNFDVYISHYDQDHFYYIKYLLDNDKFNIGTVYLPEIKKIKEQCKNFESKYKEYFKSDCANYSRLLGNVCGVSYGKGTKAAKHKVYDVDGNNKCSNLRYLDLGNDEVGGYLHSIYKNYPNVKVKYITKGDSITIGKARIDVLWQSIPNNIMKEYGKYNDYEYYKKFVGVYSNRFANNISLVSMVTAGNKKYFTAGDIQYEVEQELIREVNKGNLDLKADIMKLNHHALGTSNNIDFLKVVKPTYAFYQQNVETEDKSFITTSRSDDAWTKTLYEAQNYIDTIFGSRYNGNIVFTLTDDDIKVEVERNYSNIKLYYNDMNNNRIKEKNFVVNKSANSIIDKSLKDYNLINCDNIVRRKYENDYSYTCKYRSKKFNAKTSKKKDNEEIVTSPSEDNNTTISENSSTVDNTDVIDNTNVKEDNVVDENEEVVNNDMMTTDVNKIKSTRKINTSKTISKDDDKDIYIELGVIILLIII